MGFNASKYEGQIRAILEAPGVDLSTISAKRVRKQLLGQNDELTPELVKAHKDELDALIGLVYEQVSAEAGGEEADGGEEPMKRKREEEDVPVSSAPKKVKKEKKRDAAPSDAELARQLAQELNGRDRNTRASSSGKPKAKRARKSAKSAATVDSEGEGSTLDADGKPKRKGGFSKEYLLRCVNEPPLISL